MTTADQALSYQLAIDTAKPHFNDDTPEDVLAVVGELVNFVATAERVLGGHGDSAAARAGMAQILHGFTIGLNSNPFWRQHAAYITPVFATAVTSWGDSFGYLATDTAEDRAAFMATNNAMAEVVVAILYCAEGASAVREKSLALRRAFMNYGKPHD